MDNIKCWTDWQHSIFYLTARVKSVSRLSLYHVFVQEVQSFAHNFKNFAYQKDVLGPASLLSSPLDVLSIWEGLPSPLTSLMSYMSQIHTTDFEFGMRFLSMLHMQPFLLTLFCKWFSRKSQFDRGRMIKILGKRIFFMTHIHRTKKILWPVKDCQRVKVMVFFGLLPIIFYYFYTENCNEQF